MIRRPILLLLPLFLASCASDDGILSMPPPPSSALTAATIRTDSDVRFSALLSGRGAGIDIFSRYSPAGPSVWGENYTRRLDFSGVAWDDRRTLTLVSPSHVVMAAHYERPVGSKAVFHDRKGKPHVRTVTAIARVQGMDLSVGLLDAPVPVRYYRVLPPSTGYAQALPGCLVVVTDQHRRAFVHEVRSVTGHVIGYRNPDASRGIVLLTKSLVAGDSGNPAFLLVGGELVLVGTHTTGGPGAGPFFGSPSVQAGVNAAMAKLGGGHQLSVVPLAGGAD